ncbi:MAG: hypothetical protein M1824_002017 [Vezdaea acicularis]|nr:MAG: hypothetical protein M1824_002017 [Vezdaea acicularis]
MLHTKSNDKFRADKAAVSCCGWAVFMGCCIGSTKVGARDVVGYRVDYVDRFVALLPRLQDHWGTNAIKRHSGILAMGATNNFIGANFILGQANLANPDYTIQRWHTVLVAYAIVGLSVIINIYGPHLLDKLSRGLLVWNIMAFVVVIVTILATNKNKQSASFVFKDFQNFTGFSAAFAAILGLLQAAFGMCCYDAPAHMTEEMKNASREAPKAIVMSVYVGAITGLIFLISICFCIGDITATATSSTGVPLIQIFYDSTQSTVGACFLSSLIAIIVLGSANALLAEGSRSVYAFARDQGLPFSSFFSQVEKKKQIPVYAILLSAVFQMALNAIYFGTVTGFNTVIAISTEGFYLSYALPLIARLLSRFSKQHRELPGPYRLSPSMGLFCNIVGLAFLLFTSVTFNFPSLSPVDKTNMNYTSAAIGVIALVSLVTWFTTGRKNFSGPAPALEVVQREHEHEHGHEYKDGKGLGVE